MRKQFILSFLALTTAGCVMAQNAAVTTTTTTTQTTTAPAPGGMQQKTPSERTKETLLKLQDALPFTGNQGGSSYPVFLDYYTALQKSMDEMRASGTFDREAMKATRDKLSSERDAKLAAIYTPEQMTKWTTVIEPSLRPQRGGQKQ